MCLSQSPIGEVTHMNSAPGSVRPIRELVANFIVRPQQLKKDASPGLVFLFSTGHAAISRRDESSIA